MPRDEIIIKNTHRGLRYEDGRLTEVLEAVGMSCPSSVVADPRSRSC